MHKDIHFYVGQVQSSFTSQPQDVSVIEGSEARFGCTFDGSPVIPTWKINGEIYLWSSLPAKHTYDGRQLTIQDVDNALNGSTYQCLIPGVALSSEGLLIVIMQPEISIVSSTTTIVSALLSPCKYVLRMLSRISMSIIIIVTSMGLIIVVFYIASTYPTLLSTSSTTLQLLKTTQTTGLDIKSFKGLSVP